ncbi:hypothetical protein UlMin_024193 [Ulmus minor]
MWFNFDGKPARFSVYEFAVVMGLCCSELPMEVRSEACQNRLRDTYFKTNAINTSDLLNKIKKWLRGKPQEDRLKIALVYFLESTLLSSDPKKSVSQFHLSMVDNLKTFNRFPWGSVVYPATLKQLQTRDLRAKYANYKEQLEAKGKKATYTLYGFPFAFMVSILFFVLS